MNRYPDKRASASDGEAFARLCVKLHIDHMGEDVGYHETAQEQLDIGESRMGVEFKHLQKSFDRLHIEVAERKTTAHRWFPSGIFARSNTKRYVCGNDDDIWAFDVRDLRQIVNHRDHQPTSTRWFTDPTILSYVLDKRDALTFYRYRFIKLGDGRYKLMRRGFVGYDGAGRFVAYCRCGELAPYGYGVSLIRDQLGTHYCREHRPQ